MLTQDPGSVQIPPPPVCLRITVSRMCSPCIRRVRHSPNIVSGPGDPPPLPAAGQRAGQPRGGAARHRQRQRGGAAGALGSHGAGRTGRRAAAAAAAHSTHDAESRQQKNRLPSRAEPSRAPTTGTPRGNRGLIVRSPRPGAVPEPNTPAPRRSRRKSATDPPRWFTSSRVIRVPRQSTALLETIPLCLILRDFAHQIRSQPAPIQSVFQSHCIAAAGKRDFRSHFFELVFLPL